MSGVNFDDYFKNYNEILKRQLNKFGDISYFAEYKVKLLSKLINNTGNLHILEYGCGIGRNLEFFKKYFQNSYIYATDISKESINFAKDNYKNVIFFNLEEMKNYVEYFDIVFIAGVYHHIKPEDRLNITHNIYKVVKKSGLVIVFEHNPYNPLTRKLVHECVFDKDAILLTLSELKDLFVKNNFKDIKSGYILFIPPKLKNVSFIEKYITWLPLGGQYYALFEKKFIKTI